MATPASVPVSARGPQPPLKAPGLGGWEEPQPSGLALHGDQVRALQGLLQVHLLTNRGPSPVVLPAGHPAPSAGHHFSPVMAPVASQTLSLGGMLDSFYTFPVRHI